MKASPMSRPRLFVTRRLPPAVEARILRDYDARLNETDQVLSSATLIAAAKDYDALLVTPTERLNAETIAALPASIKIIATFSVGFEHIDVTAAQDRNIAISHTPNVLTDATADIAMLLILAAARRAYEGERLVRTGGWAGWSADMLVGISLGGKRLGLLGMGRIGQATAKRARAFGLEIHYHNRRRLPPENEQGGIYHDTAESLLSLSDILSLHAPSTPKTRGFLNAERLALMPKGAIVVNTARGDLVEDDDLIAALQSGHIKAAGLDVFRNEPRLHPGYVKLENVFLLPHLGSATIETRIAMGYLALDNLDAFFANRPLPTPVFI